jgi:RNA polymerase sigma-70 factor (ECF subfamily)
VRATATAVARESCALIEEASFMGREQQFDQFVLANYALVLALVLRRARNRHDAEDLAQDAFLAAFANPDFDPARPDAIGFVVQQACWLAADRARRPRRAALPLAFDFADHRTPDAALAIQQEEDRDEARRRFALAMEALPPRDRALFLGFYVRGISVADLASAHGLAEQTVRSILSTAKKAVLTHLGMTRTTNTDLKAMAAFAASTSNCNSALPCAVSSAQADVTSREPPMSSMSDGRDRDGNPLPVSNYPKPDKVECDTLVFRRKFLRRRIRHLLWLRESTARHDRMLCALNNRHMGVISREDCERLWEELGLGE